MRTLATKGSRVRGAFAPMREPYNEEAWMADLFTTPGAAGAGAVFPLPSTI